MKLHLNSTDFISTDEPLDISLSLRGDHSNPKAWYVDTPVFEPVRTEHYTGSVKEGGNVNFRNIFFNPHGHGTHTECLGHITEEVYSINETMSNFFFKAFVLTVEPKQKTNKGEVDFLIEKDQLDILDTLSDIEALVIRTIPNSKDKKKRNYSNSNPPYLDVDCAKLITDLGIKHLLIDLPSVDRENDDGVLAFHHAFWEVPSNPNFERTITEMIFVDNSIPDGEYILNIHIAPFENDAAPSRPVLYQIKKARI